MKTWTAWTGAEEAKLRSGRKTQSIAELALAHGRTEKAISVKLRRLKIRLPPQRRREIAQQRYWKAHAKTE